MPKPRLQPESTKSTGLEPYWQTTDGESVRFYHGDVVDVSSKMPDKSVQMVVTSPPYWALRDYGTGTWVGGDEDCDHSNGFTRNDTDHGKTPKKTGGGPAAPAKKYFKDVCGRCGAKRVDMQIGSEPSPDCGTMGKAQCGQCFVCKMVEVFTQVHRVLRDDGTLWLNLGDVFAHAGACGGSSPVGDRKARETDKERQTGLSRKATLPTGNLIGIPWRTALALQANGWVLRQDIIWHKPSPMPESATNRCTKAHEYLFLLTKKGSGYYYDAEAIKDKSATAPHAPGNNKLDASRNDHDQMEKVWVADGFKNKRSVWTIASEPLSGAHFAPFPQKLVEPCILAGTSEYGCCGDCGAPFRRVTEREQLKRKRPNDLVKRTGEEGTGNVCANTVAGVSVSTIGWEPTCDHYGTDEETGERPVFPPLDAPGVDSLASRVRNEDAPRIAPCTVLDIFLGSATTAIVGQKFARSVVGIELSETYLKNNAIPRIEGRLLSLGRGHLIPGKGPVQVTGIGKSLRTCKGDRK